MTSPHKMRFLFQTNIFYAKAEFIFNILCHTLFLNLIGFSRTLTTETENKPDTFLGLFVFTHDP